MEAKPAPKRLLPSQCPYDTWQVYEFLKREKKKKEKVGFPGGPVVKNPSCNARDTSSIHGAGKSRVPRGN